MENRARGEKICLMLLYWLLPAAAVMADCEQWAAKVVSIQGQVEAKKADNTDWTAANLDDTFCPGDSVQVGENSRAAVVLPNETLLRLDQSTTLTLTEVQTDAPSLLNLLKGVLHIISRVPRSLKVDTPYVNAAIEGTEFVLAVQDDTSTVTVFEGTVRATNDVGEVALTNGESARASLDTAPRKVLVAKPRDAVQWALYFPPIVDPTRGVEPGDPLAANALRESQSRLANNDPAGALASLEAVPAGVRDSDLHTYRASLYLYTGQVEAAREELQRALTLDPTHGEAVALQSIIALVLNDRDKAQRLADAALQARPDSDAVHIARSYVQQAAFDLAAALSSAQRAVELNPDNALAWARVSELQLAQGFLRQAQHAAETAARLNPDLAMIQTTLGFAHLAQIRIQPAADAFEKAIAQDQVNPLPRLGLGLAKIRRGKLAEGRRDIEIAASLDPNNSIVRSYLGKSYFEEKRAPLDAEQYAMAKELDPNDPTPWFYDAIRKQTENRPVEALRDIQKSIELNDNRAVFRSSLHLDADEAARSASQARIYQNLGFEQLGLVEGFNSVNKDPTSHSAHRFLTDTYSTIPRHEIARASELLQAQLLQPLNLTPIQPQFEQTNLKIIEGSGPTGPSIVEFNPMFARNRVGADISTLLGNNNTKAANAIVSGIYDKSSFSAGAFHYETDGYRENNDQEHDLANIFGQFAITPATNVQLEWRKRDSEQGDLVLNFDPEDFSKTRRETRDDQSYRIGLRQTVSPNSDFLVSYVEKDEEFSRSESLSFTPDPLTQVDVDFDQKSSADSTTGELQYIYRQNDLSLIAGAGTFDESNSRPATITTTITLIGIPVDPIVDPQDESSDGEIDHTNAYAYLNLAIPRNVTWTLGASYDKYDNIRTFRESGEEQRIERSQTNPKLGVVWNITNTTNFRAAAFRTLKRPLLNNQSIEPTQVSGFNQFFDDINGTDVKTYGIALDHRFSKSLFGGLEFTQRELDVPRLSFDTSRENDEDLHRAYLYWTPNRYVALSTEYIFDQYKREQQPDTSKFNLKTQFLPLRVSIFPIAGLFTTIQATGVKQNIDTRDITDEENFWIVDASIGYRLPNRAGVVSIGVQNLFDKEFRYQDSDFRTNEQQQPIFLPDRTVFARITISI